MCTAAQAKLDAVDESTQVDLTEIGSEGTDTLCTAFMFYKQRLASPLTVVFHFVVVRDLESNLQVCTVYNTIYCSIHSFSSQEVKQQYEKWTADCTILSIRFDDDPSPVIELDQQEQEVGPWTILPLAPPPQVWRYTNTCTKYIYHFSDLKRRNQELPNW